MTIKQIQRELNITLAQFDSRMNNGFNDQVARTLANRAQELQLLLDLANYGK